MLVHWVTISRRRVVPLADDLPVAPAAGEDLVPQDRAAGAGHVKGPLGGARVVADRLRVQRRAVEGLERGEERAEVRVLGGPALAGRMVALLERAGLVVELFERVEDLALTGHLVDLGVEGLEFGRVHGEIPCDKWLCECMRRRSSLKDGATRAWTARACCEAQTKLARLIQMDSMNESASGRRGTEMHHSLFQRPSTRRAFSSARLEERQPRAVQRGLQGIPAVAARTGLEWKRTHLAREMPLDSLR